MILADVGLGELLWSLLTIFFMVVYFMMLFSVVVDLVRDHDLSGVAKAVWFIGLLVLPLVVLLVYLVVRGNGMARRSRQQAAASQEELRSWLVDSQAGPAREIAHAKELRDEGTITDEEFETLKARALS